MLQTKATIETHRPVNASLLVVRSKTIVAKHTMQQTEWIIMRAILLISGKKCVDCSIACMHAWCAHDAIELICGWFPFGLSFFIQHHNHNKVLKWWIRCVWGYFYISICQNICASIRPRYDWFDICCSFLLISFSHFFLLSLTFWSLDRSIANSAKKNEKINKPNWLRK